MKFLSKTLPVLRADDTLPRVAQLQTTAEEALDNFGHNEYGSSSMSYFRIFYCFYYNQFSFSINGYHGEREKREAPLPDGPEHRDIDASREGRKFCDGGGV